MPNASPSATSTITTNSTSTAASPLLLRRPFVSCSPVLANSASPSASRRLLAVALLRLVGLGGRVGRVGVGVGGGRGGRLRVGVACGLRGRVDSLRLVGG